MKTLEYIGGKGGGRGSRAAQQAAAEAEEAARRAEEEKKRKEKEALDEQIKLMERKKRMGELNTRQEIRELERIQVEYAKNAELRKEMEDKIFEARARLRDEEISQLDKLNDGIITALRARYQEQRDMEQKHLDESIQAWQDWEDETVKSIRAQIDALRDAEKQEDRDEKDQKSLRKIAERQMALLYETDEYARRQLEQEIARLEEERAKMLADWARDDEIDRLEEQIQAVQDYAQAEQDKLREQKDAVDEIYDDLTKTASLQAEAEKMLRSAKKNQKEIIDLIGSYAPEYEATGKSLGERLYKGLTSAMGSISTWMDNFSKKVLAIQNEAAAVANDLANQYYSGQLTGDLTNASTPGNTTVEQVVNFYATVPQPSEVADRMEEINEELAAQLAG